MSGTTTRPARSAPTWATNAAIEEVADQSTRAPGSSPAPASRPAARLVASSKRAAVHQPASPSPPMPSGRSSDQSGAAGSASHRASHPSSRVAVGAVVPVAGGRCSVHGRTGLPSLDPVADPVPVTFPGRRSGS